MRFICKLFVLSSICSFIACSKTKIEPKIKLFAEGVQTGATVALGDTLDVVWQVDAGESALTQFVIEENDTVLFKKDNPSNPYIDTYKYIVKRTGIHQLVLKAQNNQDLQSSLKVSITARVLK